MDDAVKKFKQRRDERMKKRMDEEWITMKGTHVLIDDEGGVKGGPERIRKIVGEGGGYRPRNQNNVNNQNNNHPRAGDYIDFMEKLSAKKFTVPEGLKESDVKGMKRKDLETLATAIYANKAMESGIDKAEGVRRAKSLMSGNTDAQLRKYIVKNSRKR